jgi:hypothetical protein
MGRFRLGSLAGVGAAWGYLLRVMTRGFLGELLVNIASLGRRSVRRALLGARMFSPRILSFRGKKAPNRLVRSSPTPLGPGELPASPSPRSSAGPAP